MTVRTPTLIDLENPPPGTRLALGSVLAAAGITLADAALATGVPRTTLFRGMTENRWPAGTDMASLRGALDEAMRSRGVTAELITRAWQAHQRGAHGAALNPLLRVVPPPPARPAPAPKTPNPPKAAKAAKTNPSTSTDKETPMFLAKQSLQPEARRAFGLALNPFDGEVTCADEMYVNAELRFIRECCWQASINGRFVAVVGESGAGKTTLLADLKERIATEKRPTLVIEPSVLGMEGSDARGKVLKSGDILTAICMTLAPNTAVPQTSEKRTRAAERLLVSSTTAGNTHLLLIEEAHALPISTLKHLKRLHERMRLNGRRPMVGILLLGQPELVDTLTERNYEVREVVQRVELVRLQPLDHDLKGYLAHRCKLASKRLDELMDEGAVEALRARLTVLQQGVRNTAVSMVYPLAVNNLVIRCLNEAASLGAELITRDVVEAA